MIVRSFATVILATVMIGVFGSCAAPTGHPIRVDPNEVTRDSGGTDDISEAVQVVLVDLAKNAKVTSQSNDRVVLDRIVNNTGIADYDEVVIYNHFLSAFLNSSDRLKFLARDAVAAERDAQQSGAVSTDGVGQLKGAAMALTVELRQIPGRSTRTIQYTFRLTGLDGEILFIRAYEIRKRT